MIFLLSKHDVNNIFCLILQKRKKYDIETWWTDSFKQENEGNLHQKLVPDPFLTLTNNHKQTLHTRKQDILKENYQKALKKLLFFFFWTDFLFVDKMKNHGTSYHFIFRLQNKFRKIILLLICYLTKFVDVTWSDFWVISKIIFANLCKPIHYVLNYSTFICPFESEKCKKEGKIL